MKVFEYILLRVTLDYPLLSLSIYHVFLCCVYSEKAVQNNRFYLLCALQNRP